MRKTLSLLLILLTCSSAQVQAQNIAFKVGLGIADRYSNARPTSALMAGVAYEHEFSAHWGVAPGIFLQGKGWKEKNLNVVYDQFTKDQCPADWDDDTQTWRTGKMGEKYVNTVLTLAVPFHYYLRLGSCYYMIFSAGPYASAGVSARRTIEGDPTKTEGQRISYSIKGYDTPADTRFTGYRRFDAGLQAQIGFEFPTGITLGLQTDFGLLNQAISGAPRRQVTSMVTLTYNFHRASSYRQQAIDQYWESLQ